MTDKNKNNSEDEYAQVHLNVNGRVQGVGFRAFTQKIAVANNISGWVRNRWNGSVEVVAEGKRKDLKTFIQIIQRGPFPGTTRKVTISWIETLNDYPNFGIRMTG
jgi:acylphosphatase